MEGKKRDARITPRQKHQTTTSHTRHTPTGSLPCVRPRDPRGPRHELRQSRERHADVRGWRHSAGSAPLHAEPASADREVRKLGDFKDRQRYHGLTSRMLLRIARTNNALFANNALSTIVVRTILKGVRTQVGRPGFI